MGGAALAGRDAADHLGAVGDGLFGVEGALRAGEALADDFGVFVDEDCHLALSPVPQKRLRREKARCCDERQRDEGGRPCPDPKRRLAMTDGEERLPASGAGFPRHCPRHERGECDQRSRRDQKDRNHHLAHVLTPSPP
ncbi:hypothetical protein MASR1M65_04100 [Saprospiraceae bacterium]